MTDAVRNSSVLIQRLARQSPVNLELETDARGVGIRLQAPPLYFYHSFLTGALARRARQSGQALLKACNNKARDITSVLDLTAGWGADSLTLAQHGQQVEMLERNELICAVLAHSLACLSADPAGVAIATRMHLRQAEAFDFLSRQDEVETFDCIYLDPMFPPHKSGAKPAKEMQILQLLSDNQDIESCFRLARKQARRRVVVKRPLKAPALTGEGPDIVYREKTVRFDVYLAPSK